MCFDYLIGQAYAATWPIAAPAIARYRELVGLGALPTDITADQAAEMFVPLKTETFYARF